MIRAKICLVAEGLSIDRESNVASIFTIIEGVQAAGFPVVMQKVVFFCLWERDNNDPALVHGHFKASQGENVLIEKNIDINFGESRRNRTAITVNGLLLHGPGKVLFQLALPEQHTVAEYDVEVSGPPPAVGLLG